MDKRFYQDLLLEEEPLEEKFVFVEEEIKAQKKNSNLIEEKPIVIQEKIKVQEEQEPTMVQEKAKEENEEKAESKSTLEVVLPNVSQIHSYAFYCFNLGVELTITSKLSFYSQ